MDFLHKTICEQKFFEQTDVVAHQIDLVMILISDSEAFE